MGLVGSMGMTGNMLLKSYGKGASPLTDMRTPKKMAEKVEEELEVVTPVSYTHLDVYKRQDWNRFVTDRTIDFIKGEVAAIREGGSELPVTVKLQGMKLVLPLWGRGFNLIEARCV